MKFWEVLVRSLAGDQHKKYVWALNRGQAINMVRLALARGFEVITAYEV